MPKYAEDYIKQIIRIATRISKIKNHETRHRRSIVILGIIKKISREAHKKVQQETKSKELSGQCLLIMKISEEALAAKDSDKISAAINIIVKSGREYILSEERLSGYTISTKTLNLLQQAKLVSDMIGGITKGQATIMLIVAYSYGLDLVIGGSSLRDYRLGGDLDLGFKPSSTEFSIGKLEWVVRFSEHSEKLAKVAENLRRVISDKALQSISIGDKVNTAINNINKFAFAWYQNKFRRPLVRDRFIYDTYSKGGMPEISDVCEFFTRKGFRVEKHICIDKDGRPFGPTGYLRFEESGITTLILPRYRKGIVGEVRFW